MKHFIPEQNLEWHAYSIEHLVVLSRLTTVPNTKTST